MLVFGRLFAGTIFMTSASHVLASIILSRGRRGENPRPRRVVESIRALQLGDNGLRKNKSTISSEYYEDRFGWLW